MPKYTRPMPRKPHLLQGVNPQARAATNRLYKEAVREWRREQKEHAALVRKAKAAKQTEKLKADRRRQKEARAAKGTLRSRGRARLAKVKSRRR